MATEEIKEQRLQRYGRTVYDTETGRIMSFAQGDILYNQYNFDPVVFAWNMDPEVRPGRSPYEVFGNNPVLNVDPMGDIKIDATTAKAYPGVALLVKHAYNLYYGLALPQDVQKLVYGANLEEVFNKTMRTNFEKHAKLSGQNLDDFLKYGSGPTLTITELDYEGKKKYDGATPRPQDPTGNFSNKYWNEESKMIWIDNDVAGVLEFELTGKTSVNGIMGGGTSPSADDLNKAMLSFFSTLFHEGIHYARFLNGVGNSWGALRRDGYEFKWPGNPPRPESGKDFEFETWGEDVQRVDKEKLNKGPKKSSRNAYGGYR